MVPQRILLVRFSSIGDIVLTFGVATTIKSMYPNCSVDFVTKAGFKDLLRACEAINHVYTLETSLNELRKKIDFTQYDAILDLHHNLRTRLLLRFQFGKVYRFPKNNLDKWLLTTFKVKPKYIRHITERYIDTLRVYTKTSITGITPKYIIPKEAKIDIEQSLQLAPKKYVAIAIGAQFATKKLPLDLLIDLVNKIQFPVLLLGGKEDTNDAEQIISAVNKKDVYSVAGSATIHESAWMLKNAKCLITHDTGLMHIGAIFDLSMMVIWGNTTPDFGMYPYNWQQGSIEFFQSENLSCRPCSKIGYQQCPKGHFKCMRNQDIDLLANRVNTIKV